MVFQKADYHWMAKAIRLAEKGRYSTSPNPNVGCVIVKDGQLIAEGWHEKAGEAHAEVNAITHAQADVSKAVCYVTLEPCCHTGKTGPCVEALINAGVSKVIIAMKDPNPLVAGQGIKALRQAGIEVLTGLLETQARQLNPGFIKRMETGLPFVRIKMGCSIDGRIALHNGKSQWITSMEARRDVQHYRALSSAVMTGINTVLADNPSLNIRGIDCKGRQVKRVILDSQLQMPVDATMLELEGDTLIFTVVADADKKQQQHNARVIRIDTDEQSVPLLPCLQYLAQHEGITDVLLEAGPTLSGAFIQAGLVDEMILYQSGKILGGQSKCLFDLPMFDELEQAPEYEFTEVRMIGSNVRLTLKPVQEER